MKKHASARVRFDSSLDLSERISLVIAAYEMHGYVNRKTLIELYGVTQLQAGSLMRDFIHAHAKNLKWSMEHSHYSMAADSCVMNLRINH